MNTNEPPHSTLTYDPSHRDFLTPYLTPKSPARIAPHVTLTYASSLDGLLSVRPGESTALSSPLTKAMTHYLRSQHTAILVGAGTAIADDPGLNCRLVGTELSSQPRPIVLDPRGRWDVGMESRVVSTARKGRGKGVWVIVGDGVEYDEERKEVLERCGGRVVRVPVGEGAKVKWRDVVGVLEELGVKSLMVEGGGRVISDLLGDEGRGVVSSVVVTVAPVWLGRGGVEGRPPEGEGRRLTDLVWQEIGGDIVVCGRLNEG